MEKQGAMRKGWGGNRVRSAKCGQLTKDFGVITTSPTLAVTSSLLTWSLLLLSLFVCQCKVGQRSTRARVKLSEAKTKRRPHSAERKSEIWDGVFLCCFVVFVSFS